MTDYGRCHAIKNNGYRCQYKARPNGVCGKHQNRLLQSDRKLSYKKTEGRKNLGSYVKDLNIADQLRIDMNDKCVLPEMEIKLFRSKQMRGRSCNFYEKPMSEREIRSKWNTLLHWLGRYIGDSFEDLTAENVLVTLQIFDAIYFGGYIWNSLCKNSKIIDFIVYIGSTDSSGGFLKRYKNGYSIGINKKILLDIFSKGEIAYQSNGRPCRSRLECYASMFGHELVHLITYHFCSDDEHHGQTFMRFMRNMYNFTDFTHEILPERKNLIREDQRKALMQWFEENPDSIRLEHKSDEYVVDILKVNRKSVFTRVIAKNGILTKPYKLQFSLNRLLLTKHPDFVGDPQEYLEQEEARLNNSIREAHAVTGIGSKVYILTRDGPTCSTVRSKKYDLITLRDGRTLHVTFAETDPYRIEWIKEMCKRI